MSRLGEIIDEFVSELEGDSIVNMADVLSIEHDRDNWLDDEYPGKEADLAVKVGEKISELVS